MNAISFKTDCSLALASSLISSKVTHVVSDCSDVKEVLSAIQPTGEGREPAHVVTTAWLSTCIKAKRVLPVQDWDRLPEGATQTEEEDQQVSDAVRSRNFF